MAQTTARPSYRVMIRGPPLSIARLATLTEIDFVPISKTSPYCLGVTSHVADFIESLSLTYTTICFATLNFTADT